MTAGARRADGTLRAGLERWLGMRHPGRGAVEVALRRPAAGWSNETVLVTATWADGDERFVVRLPPLVPSYPTYDLTAQACVLEALAGAGMPVPATLAVEHDETWLGAPFLVMSHAPGRAAGEIPALDPWVVDAPLERQRRIHEGFVAALAAVHRVDWRSAGLGAVLRAGLAAEIGHWLEYVEWAADGDPPGALVDALRWCRDTAPAGPPPSLLWGDARLGNVLYHDDGAVAALLDWELASIGPAEMDVGWYLALDGLTTRFVGRTVPGFLARHDLIRVYEAALGRPLADLAWHEVFALARSVAVNDRQARLAEAAGVDYPGVAGDDNPLLHHLTGRIERHHY